MAEFGRQYGITFRDPGLLKLALTHRSYLHVTGQEPRESNERLEFLGDSVLGLVTSEFLYRSQPGEHEGQLTKTKSLLVSKAILSRRALAMGLGRYVLMSHSEVESGGRQRLSILADAFESVIGAIYLDQGFEESRAFIERWLLRESRVIAADRRHTNYKSHLQEYVQSTFRTHPVYRIRSEMGPDHSKQFMVEVMVGRRVLGEGRGRNKKEAEQAAARHALEAVERGPISDRESRRAVRQGLRGAPTAGRGRRPAPSAGAEIAAPLAEESAAEDDERGGRRRRGRRGGRGRRVRSEPATGGSPAPVARPVELEPRPPAREEDDLDEVGRPEGPLEERHVDPYAWEHPGASTRTPEGASRPAAAVTARAPAASEPGAREEEKDAPALRPDPRATVDEAGGEAASEGGKRNEEGEEWPASDDEDPGPRYPETGPPPPASVIPTWGRRGRRGR